MRLHYGAVPEDKSFEPEREGWTSIREPNPHTLQLLAMPVAVVTAALLISLVLVVLPRGLYPSNQVTLSFSAWCVLLILVGLFPVHELIHAVCTPQWGLSDKTILGVWASKFMLYVYYKDCMSRSRFLFIQLAPFAILSLAPIGIMASFRTVPLHSDTLSSLMVLSLFNGIASSGDLLGAVLLLSQVPGPAWVRNKGWRTYWRLDGEQQ